MESEIAEIIVSNTKIQSYKKKHKKISFKSLCEEDITLVLLTKALKIHTKKQQQKSSQVTLIILLTAHKFTTKQQK